MQKLCTEQIPTDPFGFHQNVQSTNSKLSTHTKNIDLNMNMNMKMDMMDVDMNVYCKQRNEITNLCAFFSLSNTYNQIAFSDYNQTHKTHKTYQNKQHDQIDQTNKLDQLLPPQSAENFSKHNQTNHHNHHSQFNQHNQLLPPQSAENFVKHNQTNHHNQHNQHNQPNHLLPPQSIENKGKRTIVFDLDETLVHSLLSFQQEAVPVITQKNCNCMNKQQNHKKSKLKQNQKGSNENPFQSSYENHIQSTQSSSSDNHIHSSQSSHPNQSTQSSFTQSCSSETHTDPKADHNVVYVLIRPFAKYVIEELSKYYEIVIFTASEEQYATEVLNIIDPNHITLRLFRNSCTVYSNAFVKDLSKLGRSLENVIIVDNSEKSFLLHPNNGIHITTWTEKTDDKELLDLLEMLTNDEFFSCSDVRNLIEKMKSNGTL